MADRRRIAIDVSPLLGQRTGVGESVALLLQGLARADTPSNAYRLFANSLRNDLILPEECVGPFRDIQRRRLPHRWLLRWWECFDHPPIEWLSGRVDVFHATNFFVPPRRRCKTIATIHDLYFMRDKGYGEALGGAWFREVLPRSLARTDAVIVPSQATRDAFNEHFPRFSGGVHVVPWGMDPLPEPPDSRRVGPPHFVAIGTLEPRKDYLLMVEGFARFLNEAPEAHLTIVGGDGGERAAVTERIETLGISGHVTLAGYLPMPAFNSLLREAHALLSTSLDEGFCLPLLHGMRHGVPAVVTPAGALPEVVGGAGVVLTDRHPDTLATGLQKVLRERDALSKRALERLEEYSLERLGSKTADVYAIL